MQSFIRLKYKAARITVQVLFVIFSLLSNIALAQDILFVTEELHPLQYMQNGELKGNSINKIHEAIKGTKLEAAKIEVFPWARAYKMAQERKNTFIFSMVRTPQREEKFQWIALLHDESFGFYAKKPIDKFQISSIDDAKKYRTVALIKDINYELLLKHGFVIDKNLLAMGDIDSVFKMFFNNRADLILSSEFILRDMADKNGFDMNGVERVFTVKELSGQYYLAANKDTDPELVDSIRAAFEEEHSD